MKKVFKRGCACIVILVAILLSLGIVAAVRVIGPLFSEGANVLILFNNTDEMRGTGGFTTAYMTITRHKGDFVTHLGSSYEIDTPPSENGAVLVVPPPRPMHDYMGIDRWSFRDANWSPDYPTSAQAASQFYTQVTKAQTPLYVITVNMTALRTLMLYLPPLKVACDVQGLACQAPTVLLENNILDWLRRGWNESASGAEGDKSFLGHKAHQMIKMIRALPFSDQWGAIPAVNEMLMRGDVMLYSSDPQIQAFFAGRGWSGPFPLAAQGDVIVYSENNIGYNKTSSRLFRDFHYSVDFTQSPPIATLKMSYTLALRKGDARDPSKERLDDPRLSECDTVDSVGALALGIPTYEDRMLGCAWIYGQIYPLPGSKLIDYDVPSIAADQFPFGLRGQTGRIDALQAGSVKGWGYVMVIPYGETRTVTLTYTLLETLSDTDYTITLPAVAGMMGGWRVSIERKDGSFWQTFYNVWWRQFYGTWDRS